jgi:NitT/TauT family transport system ATP-binding protein
MPKDSGSNKIIEFDNVSKSFEPHGDMALSNVSFSVRPGEFLCIIGPSGGGKSTVLNIIAGLEKESSGKVKKPDNVAMVFQSGALFPWLTVFENVAFGLRARGKEGKPLERATRYFIDLLGLEGLEYKYPNELSGGQRQRVGIARALAVNPSVLLLDEPFSSLDPKTTAELHDDLLKIWENSRQTIVMVSHLIEEAVTLAERVVLLKDYSIAGTYDIGLRYPRREQAEDFIHEVHKIRRDFFK